MPDNHQPDHAARVREARDAVLNAMHDIATDADASDQGPTVLRVAVEVIPPVDALIAAAEAKGRAEAFAEAVRIVEGEEEADGPMPDVMWSRFQMAMAWGEDRSGAEAIVRGTISAAKKSIIAALQRQGET